MQATHALLQTHAPPHPRTPTMGSHTRAECPSSRTHFHSTRAHVPSNLTNFIVTNQVFIPLGLWQQITSPPHAHRSRWITRGPPIDIPPALNPPAAPVRAVLKVQILWQFCCFHLRHAHVQLVHARQQNTLICVATQSIAGQCQSHAAAACWRAQGVITNDSLQRT